MASTKPFANENGSISIDDLTVENRTDRVSLYGPRDHLRNWSDRLAQFVGVRAALQDGVLPFLPGDAVKVVLAALLTQALARVEGIRR